MAHGRHLPFCGGLERERERERKHEKGVKAVEKVLRGEEDTDTETDTTVLTWSEI